MKTWWNRAHMTTWPHDKELMKHWDKPGNCFEQHQIATANRAALRAWIIWEGVVRVWWGQRVVLFRLYKPALQLCDSVLSFCHCDVSLSLGKMGVKLVMDHILTKDHQASHVIWVASVSHSRVNKLVAPQRCYYQPTVSDTALLVRRCGPTAKTSWKLRKLAQMKRLFLPVNKSWADVTRRTQHSADNEEMREETEPTRVSAPSSAEAQRCAPKLTTRAQVATLLPHLPFCGFAEAQRHLH